MDFEFFLKDNISGYKTREEWLKKNHPNFHSQVIEHTSNLTMDVSFKEKLILYFKNIKERPTCKCCSNKVNFTGKLTDPYNEFCSIDCFNSNKEIMMERIKKSNNERFGTDYFSQTKDFLTKRDITKELRYGDKNYNNVKKSKETRLLKYGSENYNNHEKYKNTLLNRYGVDNFSKTKEFKNINDENFRKKYPELDIISIDNSLVKIRCEKCLNEYDVLKHIINDRIKRNINLCTICNPIGISFVSSYEKEFREFLNELNIEFESSNRTILNKKELDIYIPKYNLAIEFDGLYWHNELFVDKDYHLEKTNLCKENDIELLHIFEDEWLYKKDIVKSIIKYKLNLITDKIFARKCNLKEITNNECKDFYEENHIQGHFNSKVNIGLFYNNELVSIMSFSKGRIIMSGKEDEWELTRFVVKINKIIIGGADKLFKYFLSNYKPHKIISYSDKRLFNGNLYKQLGFQFKHDSKPNYWYVHQMQRYYRFNYRKSELVKQGFDNNKTEHQIMLDRNIYRIYDCGVSKWEFINGNDR